MADTFTTALNLDKPEPGASRDTWGVKNNANFDLLDAALAAGFDGGCRLSLPSTTSIKMVPYGSNILFINGVMYQVPSAGVTYNATGLTTNTGYYIYAYMNAGVMTLELSTTAYTLDATGKANKTGDATRRLVGWVLWSGTVFSFVANYFNRVNKWQNGSNQTNSTASTTAVALVSCSYFAWLDEAVLITDVGYATPAANQNVYTLIQTDPATIGTLVGGAGAQVGGGAATAIPVPISQAVPFNVGVEGIHIAALYGYVNTGAAVAFYNTIRVMTRC